MSILSRLFKRKPPAEGGGLFADVSEGSSDLPSRASKPQKVPKKAAKASSMEAQLVDLMNDETNEVIAAFGVRWRTLVKVGGREEAHQMAFKAKATHFTLRNHLLGYGIVPKHIEGQIFPAAMLVAKQTIGTAIFAVNLGNRNDDGRSDYWFAMVRGSLPTNTDEVLRNQSQREVLERVRALIAQFEGEEIVVFSDISTSGLDNQRNYSLRQIFDVVRSDQDRFQKLPNKGSRIPKPLLIATILGAVVLAAQKGYSEYQAYQARLAREANQVIEELPEVAWAPVVAGFIAKTPKPNPKDFLDVRRSLDDQPLLWFGWQMAGSRCTAGDLIQMARTWTCQSTYERSRIGETSEKMVPRVKQRYPDAVVAFPSISQMVVSWSLKQNAEPIVLAELGNPDDLSLRVQSQLQTVLPSLTDKPNFKMLPFELKPPLRKDGKPHPKPATVPNLFIGNLVLKGPMRSIDFATQDINSMQWDSMGLVFNYKTAPASKNLTSSSLSVELTGKLYATK